MGTEENCDIKEYIYNNAPSQLNNNSNVFTQLLNKNELANPNELKWFSPNSLPDGVYDKNGDYYTEGEINISDNGPPNIDNIVKDINSFLSTYQCVV
jgi:hypothetical protein